jgi:hypothetical protein
MKKSKTIHSKQIPPNFKEVWDGISLMRSEMQAPVDSMGVGTVAKCKE